MSMAISDKEKRERLRKKRHHYIPIWLQRLFCNADGKLYAGNTMSGKEYMTSPQNLFVAKRGYSVVDPESGELLGDAEEAYAYLDGAVCPAVRAVLQSVERAEDKLKTPRISIPAVTRQALETFTIQQTKRRPHKWDHMIADSPKVARLPSTHQKLVMLAATVRRSPRMVENLESRELVIARVGSGGELILGDELVCLDVQDAYSGGRQNTGVLGMPIEKRTMLLWSPRPRTTNSDAVSVVPLDLVDLKRINRTVTEQSTTIAGANEATIHQLILAVRRRRRRGGNRGDRTAGVSLESSPAYGFDEVFSRKQACGRQARCGATTAAADGQHISRSAGRGK